MNIKIEKKLRKNPEENNNMRLGVMGGVFDPCLLYTSRCV